RGLLRAADRRQRHAPEPLGAAAARELPAPRRPGAGVRALREDRPPLHQEPRPYSRRLQGRWRSRRPLGSGVGGWARGGLGCSPPARAGLRGGFPLTRCAPRPVPTGVGGGPLPPPPRSPTTFFRLVCSFFSCA